MGKISEQDILMNCGLCYRLCKCYRVLDNNIFYCGCTGKLTNEGIYCHALISTSGSIIVDPFDNYPDKIKYSGYDTYKLIDEIGESNYKILVECANLRGLSEVFIYKIVHEFNWFIKVINIGNLSDNEEYKYLYNTYNEYNNSNLDELVEQFKNYYCIVRYSE